MDRLEDVLAISGGQGEAGAEWKRDPTMSSWARSSLLLVALTIGARLLVRARSARATSTNMTSSSSSRWADWPRAATLPIPASPWVRSRTSSSGAGSDFVRVRVPVDLTTPVPARHDRHDQRRRLHRRQRDPARRRRAGAPLITCPEEHTEATCPEGVPVDPDQARRARRIAEQCAAAAPPPDDT